MDLLKPGCGKGGNKRLRFLHGFGFRLVRPDERAKVVSAEKDPLGVKVLPRRYAMYIGNKIRGRHARVAAELVDLVRGGLKKQRLARAPAMLHGRSNDQCIGAAHGANGSPAARFVLPDEIGEEIDC